MGMYFPGIFFSITLVLFCAILVPGLRIRTGLGSALALDPRRVINRSGPHFPSCKVTVAVSAEGENSHVLPGTKLIFKINGCH